MMIEVLKKQGGLFLLDEERLTLTQGHESHP